MAVAAMEVAKMKFYDREPELNRIRNEVNKLKHHSSIIVLAGRRRIGKTRLIVEAFKDKPFLYFFVGKKKIPDLLIEWTEEINRKIGPVYGEFPGFSQFVAYLFHLAEEKEVIVFFDEVQNLLAIEPSAFSDLQKHYDLNRENTSLLLIFAGSSHSLIGKIFTASKEPLFGRAAEFFHLNYLPVKTQKDILNDHHLYSGENLLHMFSIFDGIPRFYEEIIDTGETDFKNALRELIVNKDFLWEEGLNMMREEFGKDYFIYHSILSAIAGGKRTRNEIEQAVHASVGGYLQNLENIYYLVKKNKPLFGSSKSGTQRYYLADNFFEFWFGLISRFQALKEINQKDKAFEKIWELLPQYEGLKFEALIKRIFIEINPFGLEFTTVGKYWDRKGENEIDLILADQGTRTAHVVEVKRVLAKSVKEQEKIKFYTKISTIGDLNGYSIRYYFAGMDNRDIVIAREDDERFVL